MQLTIQSDVITHTSLVFVLCHGYQWCSIEKSGVPPICLFNNYWLPQKQMWQKYISICSIVCALQDAVAKTCICQTFKKSYDIPTYSPEPQKQQVTPLRLVINLPVAVHIAAFPLYHLTDAPF